MAPDFYLGRQMRKHRGTEPQALGAKRLGHEGLPVKKESLLEVLSS